MEALKSQRKHVTVPGILANLIEKRAEMLGYKSVSGYLLGLILFDLWCRKPHALTLQIVNEDSQAMKDAVFGEIAGSFDKPAKESSYFEHRLSELAEQITLKNTAAVNQ